MPSKHYPQEYLDGQVEFFYLDFFVDEHVLIPRLETESLVRRVIQDTKNLSPNILIDVGTGSGIIPISIAKTFSACHPELVSGSPDNYTSIYALDISAWALEVAQKNAVKHGVQIEFRLSNLLSSFLTDPTVLDQKNIIITANLPYIKSDDWENMSTDTRFEPALALFGWSTTGFELYDEFFEQLDILVGICEPLSLTLYMEMGYDQSKLARQACEQHGWSCELFSDPAGIERFAKINIS